MKILYDNKITNATLTVSSENPDYTFSSGFNDTRLSRKARTTATSGQYILMDFGTPIDVDYIGLLGSNISSGAVVFASGGSTSGTTSVSTTLTDYETYIGNFSSTQSYRYWRVDIDDPDNTNTYIEIGQLYIGTALEMPPMPRGGQELPLMTTSTFAKSTGGQLYGDERLLYREAKIAFADAIMNNYKPLIDAFFREVQTIKPFILLVWENDLDEINPIYCHLTTPLEWKKYNGEDILWNLSLEFSEVF